MHGDIFKRASLEQISSLILFQEETQTKSGSYEERLEKIREEAYDIFPKILNQKDYYISDGRDDLAEAFDIYEEICVQIGMKIGAKLVHELLLTNDSLHTNTTPEKD